MKIFATNAANLYLDNIGSRRAVPKIAQCGFYDFIMYNLYKNSLL